MASSSSSQQPGMNWMYSGPSAIVDREKYLLGAQIDKNFELFGTDGKKETIGGIDALLTKAAEQHKRTMAGSSALDLETVRKEDPLVAIKVREEKAKQELLNNPVKMKRLQKLVVGAMQKKMKKALKKEYKQHKKEEKKRKKEARKNRNRKGEEKQRADDSSDSDKDSKQRHKSRSNRRPSRSPSPVRRRESNGSDRHRSHTSSSQPSRLYKDQREQQRRSRSRSQSRERRPRHERQPDSKRRRSRSLSESAGPSRRSNVDRDDSASAQTSERRRTTTSIRRKSRSPSCSDSDDERRKQKFSGYGLVKVKKEKSASPPTAKKRSRSRSRSPLASYSGRLKNVSSSSTKPDSKPPERRKQQTLTAEQKEARLREMQSNADWREKQRDKNLKMYAERDRSEIERNETGRKKEGVDFMRPMLASAAESSSVEERLKRKRGNLQRSHGAMDRSFTQK